MDPGEERKSGWKKIMAALPEIKQGFNQYWKLRQGAAIANSFIPGTGEYAERLAEEIARARRRERTAHEIYEEAQRQAAKAEEDWRLEEEKEEPAQNVRERRNAANENAREKSRLWGQAKQALDALVAREEGGAPAFFSTISPQRKEQLRQYVEMKYQRRIEEAETLGMLVNAIHEDWNSQKSGEQGEAGGKEGQIEEWITQVALEMEKLAARQASEDNDPSDDEDGQPGSAR